MKRFIMGKFREEKEELESESSFTMPDANECFAAHRLMPLRSWSSFPREFSTIFWSISIFFALLLVGETKQCGCGFYECRGESE